MIIQFKQPCYSMPQTTEKSNACILYLGVCALAEGGSVLLFIHGTVCISFSQKNVLILITCMCFCVYTVCVPVHLCACLYRSVLIQCNMLLLCWSVGS